MKPERHKQGGKGRRDGEKGRRGETGDGTEMRKRLQKLRHLLKSPYVSEWCYFTHATEPQSCFHPHPPFLWQREQDHKRQMQSCRFNGLMAMNKNGAVTDLLIDFMCNWHTLGSSVNTAHKAGCVAVLSHRHRIKLLTVERPEG